MIDTGAGVIDADYRGTVFVLLFNLSDKDFEGKFVSSIWVVVIALSNDHSARGRPHCSTGHRENMHSRGYGSRGWFYFMRVVVDDTN